MAMPVPTHHGSTMSANKMVVSAMPVAAKKKAKTKSGFMGYQISWIRDLMAEADSPLKSKTWIEPSEPAPVGRISYLNP